MADTVTEKKIVGPVTAASGGGAAVAMLVCWGLKNFAQIDVPPEIQGALAFLLALASGYLVPTSRSGEHSA